MATNEIFTITKTIVTDTNIYASGDFVGTAILQLDDVITIDGTELQTITLTDKSKQSAATDFLFWATACANTTFTNNGALDINATDLLQFLGGVSLVAGDYAALSSNSVATKRDIQLYLNPALTGKTIYCTPVCRGTPTYAASALQVSFVFCRG